MKSILTFSVIYFWISFLFLDLYIYVKRVMVHVTHIFLPLVFHCTFHYFHQCLKTCIKIDLNELTLYISVF